MPIKLITRFTLAVLGAIGLSSTSVIQSSAAATLSNTPTAGFVHKTEGPIVEGVTGSTSWDQAPTSVGEERMIDQIGKMAEENAEMEETNVDDISPEERKRQEQMPRNPKKRMYEGSVKEDDRRDEL